jgi:hypothetical protein
VKTLFRSPRDPENRDWLEISERTAFDKSFDLKEAGSNIIPLETIPND